MKYGIVNGKVLTHGNEWVEGPLLIEDHYISDIGGPSVQQTIDAKGCLVLPGIIDMHGDAFEHLIMPREGTFFPMDIALYEADRQMIANGITTGYLSFTLTWESQNKLRNTEGAGQFYSTFSNYRKTLLAAHKTHLRFEIYHLEGVETVKSWLRDGQLDLISFNDHIPYIDTLLRNEGKLRDMAHRIGLTPEETLNLYREISLRKPEALKRVKEIAELCVKDGIIMASHDEEDRETRDWYHSIGCRICEFPCNEEVAYHALQKDDAVVMGAPNVLNGRSLYNRLSVRECVQKELCSILASDYYYPSPLQAIFLMERLGICNLAHGWDLVSKNAARALQLNDRGTIERGKRADIVIVNTATFDRPAIMATIINGEPVFFHRSWQYN